MSDKLVVRSPHTFGRTVYVKVVSLWWRYLFYDAVLILVDLREVGCRGFYINLGVNGALRCRVLSIFKQEPVIHDYFEI